MLAGMAEWIAYRMMFFQFQHSIEITGSPISASALSPDPTSQHEVLHCGVIGVFDIAFEETSNCFVWITTFESRTV